MSDRVERLRVTRRTDRPAESMLVSAEDGPLVRYSAYEKENAARLDAEADAVRSADEREQAEAERDEWQGKEIVALDGRKAAEAQRDRANEALEEAEQRARNWERRARHPEGESGPIFSWVHSSHYEKLEERYAERMDAAAQYRRKWREAEAQRDTALQALAEQKDKIQGDIERIYEMDAWIEKEPDRVAQALADTKEAWCKADHERIAEYAKVFAAATAKRQELEQALAEDRERLIQLADLIANA